MKTNKPSLIESIFNTEALLYAIVLLIGIFIGVSVSCQ